jgi:glutamate dehydrogenase
VDLSAATLGRILMRIRTKPGEMAGAPDLKALEGRLIEAMRRWEDDLYAALLERHGEARANDLFRIYEKAFPASYREEYSVREAVTDIQMIESLDPATDLGMNLHVREGGRPGVLDFKIYRRGSALPLSDSVPMLERLGVRVQYEHPHQVEPAGAAAARVVDFGLVPSAGSALDVAKVRDAFHDALFGMFSGTVEADSLNRLVLTAGLTAREITVLRAYARYFTQTGWTFSRSYVDQALAANPGIAALLVRLFFARFKRGGDEASLVEEIATALDEVQNLDEDRILRTFLAVMRATNRTNYFLNKEFVSFKFDPKGVPNLPEPRPMFEIWVYSPRFEAVHLRGGRVARGGLRWSDRMEDFRTEVLGLMKAQMVKNVVIVPVGA